MHNLTSNLFFVNQKAVTFNNHLSSVYLNILRTWSHLIDFIEIRYAKIVSNEILVQFRAFQSAYMPICFVQL